MLDELIQSRSDIAFGQHQYTDDGDFRISIAGAQEKTAFLFYDGQWCKPRGATSTTHILKLPTGKTYTMHTKDKGLTVFVP